MKSLFKIIAFVVIGGSIAHGDLLDVTADSWVREGAPTSWYGTQSGMYVTASERKVYLKFDVSSLTNTTSAATLNLVLSATVPDVDGGGAIDVYELEVFGVKDSASLDGWDETSLKWNNAPANAPANALTADAVSLGTFVTDVGTAAGTTIQFTSASLASFIDEDTDGFITLILVQNDPYPGTGDTLSLATKENTTYNGSSLNVTMVPEPMSIGLLGLGVAATLFIRRMNT